MFGSKGKSGGGGKLSGKGATGMGGGKSTKVGGISTPFTKAITKGGKLSR